MSIHDRLEDFLGNALGLLKESEVLPTADVQSVEEWAFFLDEAFGLVAVPAQLRGASFRSYPLWLAEHEQHGPILIKYIPGMIRGLKTNGLILRDAKNIKITAEDIAKIRNEKILFEPYQFDGKVDLREIRRYLFRPIRGLRVTALLMTGFIALLGSALFMTNFYLLLSVVPSQNMGAYWSVAWLIAGIVSAIFLGNYFLQKFNDSVSSYAQERAELLKLSMIWSLRPGYISENGLERIRSACEKIASIGQASDAASRAIIASLAMVPVLILMTFRIPETILGLTLLAATSVTVFHVFNAIRRHKVSTVLSVGNHENNFGLLRLVNHADRLRFYGEISRKLSEWSARSNRLTAANHKLSANTIFENENRILVLDTIQLLAIAVLAFMISKRSSEAPALAVAGAYMIFHLINQMFMMLPKLAVAFEVKAVGRAIMGESSDILEELEAGAHLATPAVKQARAQVHFKDFSLPYGCMFAEAERLDRFLDGKQVVRIMGESGYGKTTLLRCILGIQKPAAGTVTVFGADPAALSLKERYRIFSYADQGIHLVPGTLRTNLCMFDTGSRSDRSIWSALEKVQLLERVQKLPLGLDTSISNARRDFSTGERQRLALAQCISKRSAILILDEALSGTSAELETKIFSDICPLFKQVYFTSHRMHMADCADTIIKLDAPRAR